MPIVAFYYSLSRHMFGTEDETVPCEREGEGAEGCRAEADTNQKQQEPAASSTQQAARSR